MGTKAVFAVASRDKPTVQCWTTIIGMTSDGFPNNLEYIAQSFQKKMTELRVKTKIKRRDWAATLQVMQAMIDDHKGWLFLDDVKNAEWVSHSVIYDPITNKTDHHNGMP
jgi:hypothetical protein